MQDPRCFVHGEKDDFVPSSTTMQNYEACAAEKKLFISPNAGHALSFIESKDEYSALLREFITSHI